MTVHGFRLGQKKALIHTLLVNALLLPFKSGLVKKRENTQTHLITLKKIQRNSTYLTDKKPLTEVVLLCILLHEMHPL
jgi:hypothetical protein